MSLTDRDRGIVARARKLATTTDVTGHTGEDDLTMAYAVAFGEAQFLLGELAGLAERLAAAGPGAGR